MAWIWIVFMVLVSFCVLFRLWLVVGVGGIESVETSVKNQKGRRVREPGGLGAEDFRRFGYVVLVSRCRAEGLVAESAPMKPMSPMVALAGIPQLGTATPAVRGRTASARRHEPITWAAGATDGEQAWRRARPSCWPGSVVIKIIVVTSLPARRFGRSSCGRRGVTRETDAAGS
jgi:hypothetical protein